MKEDVAAHSQAPLRAPQELVPCKTRIKRFLEVTISQILSLEKNNYPTSYENENELENDILRTKTKTKTKTNWRTTSWKL